MAGSRATYQSFYEQHGIFDGLYSKISDLERQGLTAADISHQVEHDLRRHDRGTYNCHSFAFDLMIQAGWPLQRLEPLHLPARETYKDRKIYNQDIKWMIDRSLAQPQMMDINLERHALRYIMAENSYQILVKTNQFLVMSVGSRNDDLDALIQERMVQAKPLAADAFNYLTEHTVSRYLQFTTANHTPSALHSAVLLGLSVDQDIWLLEKQKEGSPVTLKKMSEVFKWHLISLGPNIHANLLDITIDECLQKLKEASSQ
ncbi:MAG: hypothetical protein ABIC04_03810 [Nanoarchaeota archaeon]